MPASSGIANNTSRLGDTIVDAAIIPAPSSTKHKAKARDPDRHQTRQGNQWRASQTQADLRCCAEDGSTPPEAGLQEQASDHPVLLWSKRRGDG